MNNRHWRLKAAGTICLILTLGASMNAEAQTAKNKLPNKLGTCREYRANDTHPVRPVFAAEQYYLEFNKGPAVVAKVDNNLQIRTETYIQVVKQPDHGRLELYMPNATAADGISKYDYHYIPEKDYVGLDNFEFRVSVDGESLSVFYQVKVFPEDENPNYIGYCNWKKPTWKISQYSPTHGATSDDLSTEHHASDISSLLASKN